ncbi:MAG TPA: outer membrane beta-barrel protein [Candidatus Sulfotelmatobacter sp.]|nr:outer membrane beta-barrel protein [Candidatus Sulfotelmatobacter sp.]
MSARAFWVAVLSLVAVLAASTAAQDEKNEAGGIIGRTFVSDQGISYTNFPDPTIHSGKGLTFAGEYSHSFFATPLFSLSAEGIVAYNPKEKLNAGGYGFAVVPTSYKSLFVTPAARLNLFPTTAVSPWVSLGAGFGHFTESNMLVYGAANPGKSTTSAVLEGGLGLDVKVWSHLSMRGEVRDFWSGEPDYPLAPTGKTRQHNYFVGGGGFWRF